jgi:hypothetical protein
MMTERGTNREFDSNDKVKSTKSETREWMFIEGEPFHHLVAKDDKPLSPGDQKKEDERLRKSPRSAGEKTRRGSRNGLPNARSTAPKTVNSSRKCRNPTTYESRAKTESMATIHGRSRPLRRQISNRT